MLHKQLGNKMNYRNIIFLVIAVTLVACGGPEERKAKYLARAQDYLEAGNYPKARVALRNVLKIDPKDADAYFLFAQVEEKEKNWRNAVSLYQEVVQLAPDHSAALVTLAKYYLEARLTEQVLLTADKVLAKNPHHPQANALKIAVLAVEGQFADAMTKAEALRSQFPTEPDVAILLATLHSQQQHYRDAEATLRAALEAHPKDMDLLNNLNTILVQAKDMAGAETVAHRMIETEPTLFDHRPGSLMRKVHMRGRRPSCAKPLHLTRITRNAVSYWQIISAPEKAIVLQSKHS
jgi:Tfp pilus assembly protein PilF